MHALASLTSSSSSTSPSRSTDRVTQVELLPDGSVQMISDSTNAMSISGAWRPGDGDKFGFILER